MRRQNKVCRQGQKVNYIGSESELFYPTICLHKTHFELVGAFKAVFIGSKSDPLLYIDHGGGNNPGDTKMWVSLFLWFQFLGWKGLRKRGFSRRPGNNPLRRGIRRVKSAHGRDKVPKNGSPLRPLTGIVIKISLARYFLEKNRM